MDCTKTNTCDQCEYGEMGGLWAPDTCRRLQKKMCHRIYKDKIIYEGPKLECKKERELDNSIIYNIINWNADKCGEEGKYFKPKVEPLPEPDILELIPSSISKEIATRPEFDHIELDLDWSFTDKNGHVHRWENGKINTAKENLWWDDDYEGDLEVWTCNICGDEIETPKTTIIYKQIPLDYYIIKGHAEIWYDDNIFKRLQDSTKINIISNTIYKGPAYITEIHYHMEKDKPIVVRIDFIVDEKSEKSC